jgi:hypothetical protein
MSANEHIPSPLNDQQVMMLRLLKKPLLVVKLLAKQLDETVDKWELENDISEETYDKLSEGHFRTPSSKHPE